MTYRSLCQNYPFDDAMKYLELEKVVGSLHFQQAAQPSQPAALNTGSDTPAEAT